MTILSNSEILLNFLKESANKEYISVIYYQLFSTLNTKDLDADIEWVKSLHDGTDDFFKDSGKNNWFAIWHKQIRQTDYFRINGIVI